MPKTREMRIVRPILLATVVALVLAAASSGAVGAPSGLHGFLLRADEPATVTFHTTPSFAWNPVAGATGYQFQLSLSSTFRDNGVIYNDARVLTPVESPPLTLPWITGDPHSLYARVRALVGSDPGPWSSAFGFDVTAPAPPTPLPAPPGVLRWTPVTGADSYEVWLIDTGNDPAVVKTNVLDEREFYTFHQAAKWTGTIRWRIRALRPDVGSIASKRLNGLPAAQVGAWSPVYSSTNPPPTGGPITLGNTVSDVISDGSRNAPAHRLMPAFTWTGNQTLSGAAAELYRVYVFTDKQCLNPVYSSTITGSPSYAPRISGPLALPTDPLGIAIARSSYLFDGPEPTSLTYDYTKVTPTEASAEATPTTSAPGDVNDSGTGLAPPGSTGTGTGTGSQTISVTGVGPALDLWDTDWPNSGYYWTVVAVAPLSPGTVSTTIIAPGASKGARVVPVANASQFAIGQVVTIGTAPASDTATITAVSSGQITLSTDLQQGHGVGDQVVTNGASSLIYQDLELPQDVCAAGRVKRFGIESEPALTSGQEPFVTGLTQAGRLTSAANVPSYYGRPLVAWTPALSADIYEIQYSKTSYPFKPEIDPRSGKPGYLTFGTSDVLPLDPSKQSGTWYYRVRGFDFNLPTGTQQMGWSDPEKLVVTKPTFKLTPVKKNKFRVVKP
jgi:hypothetical protein